MISTVLWSDENLNAESARWGDGCECLWCSHMKLQEHVLISARGERATQTSGDEKYLTMCSSR